MNSLSERFVSQEKNLGKIIESLRSQLPKEVFESFFNPLSQLFEDRAKLMEEIQRVNGEFSKVLQEYDSYFKGIVQ